MRLHFENVFETLYDGSLSPKMMVRFNGETIAPHAPMPPGIMVGGIPIDSHRGEDVEVEQDGEVAIIMGFCP